MNLKQHPVHTNIYVRDDGTLFTIREIKGHVSVTNGYRHYRYKDKDRNLTFHRLIAETLIDNPDNKPQVNHKDGNRSNNHPSNLEWVTNKENALHGALSKSNACFCKIKQKWRAYTSEKGVQEFLGYFSTKEEAEEVSLKRKLEKYNKYKYKD
jgi:hypothetical protein